MSTKDDGGPAFPAGIDTTPGMSLRDYLAAKAFSRVIDAFLNDLLTHPDANLSNAYDACYRAADGMLEARKKS